MLSNRISGLALTVAAAIALCAGADSALAGGGRGGRGGKKKNTETVRMERPGDAADGHAKGNAKGTVEITETRGGTNAVIKLRNLEPRSNYDIVDTGTGELLGSVRTNKKGRANFEMGAGAERNKRGRADSAGAEEGGDNSGEDGSEEPADDKPFEDCAGVEIVWADTGESILACDFWEDGFEFDYSEGSATYGEPETGIGMVYMAHYDDGTYASESFSFTYCPPYDEEEGEWDMPHTLWLDSSLGDELPLGAASVEDLEGLEFQVKTADGAEVVLTSELPQVEAVDWEKFPPIVIDDPIEWPTDGEWDNWINFDWGDFDFENFPGTTGFMGAPDGSDRGGRNFRSSEHECWDPEPSSTFLLCIRDPESGEFVEVGKLEYYDWNFGWDDWWQGDDGGDDSGDDGEEPRDPGTGADGTNPARNTR